MSFANLLMYSAVLPSYHSDDKESNTIQADDPRNAAQVSKILFGE